MAGAVQSESNRMVKAGVFNFNGYHMKDENGALTGYGIEFLNLVSQYSHLNFSYVGYDYSWEDMLAMLDSGEIDVVTSARKTPEREEKYAFSLPIGRNNTVLSVRPDDTEHHTGTYETYNGIVVGVVGGSSQNQALEEFAQEKGFFYQSKEYSDVDKMAEDLRNGKIDAILTSDLRRMEQEKTLDTIGTNYFYAMVRKEDSDLLDEIDYAIDQMNINEGDWSNDLYYKYYGNSAPKTLSFTEREQTYIQEVAAGKKRITVTSMGDRRPYSYVEDGELKGILPEYFAKVMEMAGLSYETVVPNDRSEYYDLAENDEVDIVIDWRQNQLNTDERGRSGFYTDPYLNTGIARVTRKDFTGVISTLAVADLQGDIAIEQDMIGNAQVLNCGTREKALQAVLDGEADATYVYTYTAQSFVNSDPTASLQYSLVNSMSFDVQMYIRGSSDHELVTILNKCIGHMPDDTMGQIITKYTANAPGNVSFGQYMRANPELLVGAVALAAMAIGAIVFFYLRSVWDQKLLRTTELSNHTLKEQLAIVNTLSRDYMDVYAVNAGTGAVRFVKLEGRTADEVKRDDGKEIFFEDVLAEYRNESVFPGDREYFAQALAMDTVVEKLRDNVEYSGSYRVQHDDEVHTYQFTCASHPSAGGDEKGDIVFFLAGFRNIDEIVRREQSQKMALETALAEAQRANVAKTTFLNNMSHDIRTPMNAIIGFTSLAMSHIENREQVKGYLEKILTSGKHLLSLINDILDMSRIESGKVKFEENEVSLPEVMHDLTTIVQADIRAKQLDFHADTLDVANEIVICDRLRLNQVLLNILSNAIKYTGPGGKINVRVIQTGDAPKGYASYQFCVKDTGIGMSEEFLEHLFEPFERERTATVSGIQGTGLGLAITKNIVDRMNGTISVTSQEGKGSEFVVSFQFRIKDNTDDMAYMEKLKGLRALVVDDDIYTCTSVSKMLSSVGLRTDWTTRGGEAVIRTEFAMEQNDPFRVFLVDWQLPDGNGIEATRQLRRIVGEDATIIILTAYDWTDLETEAKGAGVTGFCSKPLFLSELRGILTAPYRKEEEQEEADEIEEFLRGRKILLVEDNELNQEIAQTVLEEAGLIVDTASDGTEAVEIMQKAPANTYDLILMDIQMPVMDGYAATRAIRAMEDPGKAKIPIVAMTANAFEEDRQKAMQAGMDGHVPKPFDPEKLMRTMKMILLGEGEGL